MNTSIHRLMNAARRRVRNARPTKRPGSVLILVVAVLLLMVIIGTAALSTNTIDRYATQQNNVNTEIDLLVEGVKNMAKGVIVGDLYNRAASPQRYRQPESAGNTYGHWDMPLLFNPVNIPNAPPPPPGMEPEIAKQMAISNDAWLSPRYPVLLYQPTLLPTPPPAFVPGNPYGSNPPVWDAVGAPLENANGLPGVGQTLFDSPGVFDGAGAMQTNAALGYNYRITDRSFALPYTNYLVPTSITYTVDPATGRQATMPAWNFTTGSSLYYIAADADGDGIADSGLKKLSIGEVNGLTYYYATRIIDNGSAINVNSAWSRDGDYLGDDLGTRATPRAVSFNFSPSSIGLAQLLPSTDLAVSNLTELQTVPGPSNVLNELGRIDTYRFNGYIRPSGVTSSAAGTNVFVDSLTAPTATRSDFGYSTLGEILSFGLTRRLNNPGVVAQPSAGVDVRFRRFAMSESAALAYHFCLTNPDASLSALEDATKQGGTDSGVLDSLYNSAGNQKTGDSAKGRRDYPFTAVGLGDWFKDNFWWENEFTLSGTLLIEDRTKYCNRRTMFTADNPVSNQIPSAVVSTGGGAGSPSAFCKASVNTGSLADLYSAFLSVMTAGNAKTPYDGGNVLPPSVETMYAYAGMRFTQPPETTDGTDQQSYTLFTPSQDTNPQRMFRNSLREHDTSQIGTPQTSGVYDDATDTVTSPVTSTNALQFEPSEMRKLRAKLAALNTLAMRNPTRNGLPLYGMIPGNPGDLTDVNSLVAKIGGTRTSVDVYAYPAEKQPYITEIYVNTDITAPANYYDPPLASGAPSQINTEPYVAIELFYPYAIPATPGADGTGEPWDMRPITTGPNTRPGWILQVLERTAARTAGALTVNATIFLDDYPNAYFDPPTNPSFGSYILLENYKDDGTGPVKYRPRGSGLPYTGPISAVHAGDPPVKKIYVENLAKAIKNGKVGGIGPELAGGELVIYRPLATSAGAPVYPDRPIDSFDFTGLDTAPFVGRVWHYARQGLLAAGGGRPWQFIYPGRYDGGKGERRQEGTQAARWTIDTTALRAAGNHDPFDGLAGSTTMIPAPSLGVIDGVTSSDSASLQASYDQTFTIQLDNNDQPGWNAISTPARWPFGAFARNGDILQIPYFGAYRVKVQGSGITGPDIEVNALPMDVAYCEDTDIFDEFGPRSTLFPAAEQVDTFEQVGRFCPVNTTSPLGLGVNAGAIPIDDLDPMPESSFRYLRPNPVNSTVTGNPTSGWRYRWATRIFDYLTVQDPQSDYLPNIDLTSAFSLGIAAPVLVSNEGGTAGDPASLTPSIHNAENAVPLHGLININTASWRVLSTINWTPFELTDVTTQDRYSFIVQPNGEYDFVATPDGVPDNVEIAKAIVWWRDGIRNPSTLVSGPIGPQGPFRTLYDLYRVPAIKTYYRELGMGGEADDAEGDFSPVGQGIVDGVRNDFEEKYLLLNRIGNLITTRSDSFTVYIVVQGWRNAGSTDPAKPPELVVQRRAAFIADRSGITATGGQLKTVNVATE